MHSRATDILEQERDWEKHGFSVADHFAVFALSMYGNAHLFDSPSTIILAFQQCEHILSQLFY